MDLANDSAYRSLRLFASVSAKVTGTTSRESPEPSSLCRTPIETTRARRMKT